MSDAPDKIYLQWIPSSPGLPTIDDEITWCQDQINDDDVVYVKKSIARELVLLREIARTANEYRKGKMHEDSLKLQKLAKEWYDTYSDKK